MEKEKKLYKAFCGYIGSCEKLSGILWDAIASTELLKSNAKQSHFINRFESTEDFKNLLKALEDFDPKKPDEANVAEYYEEYHQYKLSMSGCVQRFFINTGIYDIVISGREINKDNAFIIFLEKLEEKDIEVLKYGEVFPLKIEIKKDQVLELGDFCLLTDLDKYNVNTETKFVFLLRHTVLPHHLGTPYLYNTVETSFADSLFTLNLYFGKPVYIPMWYSKHSNLFSYYYQPIRKSSKFAERVKDKYFSELNIRYEQEAYDASSDDGYTDWGKFTDYVLEKEKEFIKSGQGPVNYLKETEITKFKGFINKTRKFLGSDVYKKQKYLQIATHYYLMAHERPDIADNLVNYIIALESLYFTKPTSEMKQRLANRIGNLLGKNPEEKTEIRNTMLDSYNLRCKYVHGGISQISHLNKEQFNNWLRNLLRISLLSFFSLSNYYSSNGKREELLNDLDSVFDLSLIENIQIQASDFSSLARPYDFLTKKRTVIRK